MIDNELICLASISHDFSLSYLLKPHFKSMSFLALNCTEFWFFFKVSILCKKHKKYPLFCIVCKLHEVYFFFILFDSFHLKLLDIKKNLWLIVLRVTNCRVLLKTKKIFLEPKNSVEKRVGEDAMPYFCCYCTWVKVVNGQILTTAQCLKIAQKSHSTMRAKRATFYLVVNN